MERFSRYVVFTGNSIVTSGSFVVNLAGTTTAASVYSDAGGLTLRNQPIPVDPVTGEIWFYAANGTYDVIISVPNSPVVTLRAVSLFDPSGFSSVSGINTQVQFNDGGVLGAHSGLLYDKTTQTFTTHTIIGDRITVGNGEHFGGNLEKIHCYHTYTAAEAIASFPNAVECHSVFADTVDSTGGQLRAAYFLALNAGAKSIDFLTGVEGDAIIQGVNGSAPFLVGVGGSASVSVDSPTTGTVNTAYAVYGGAGIDNYGSITNTISLYAFGVFGAHAVGTTYNGVLIDTPFVDPGATIGSLVGLQIGDYTDRGGGLDYAINVTGGKSILSTLILKDAAAPTKQATFGLTNITAGQTRTINIPNANSTTVQSSTAGANQFATSISAQGVVGYTQPSFANISGTATSGQIPNNAANTTGSAGSLLGTISGTSIIAEEVSNIFHLRHGTGTQANTLRLFSGFTDTTNWDGLTILADSVANACQIFVGKGGTGNAGRTLDIGTGSGSTGNIRFILGGGTVWLIATSTGTLTANGDNGRDIGATGSGRPRSVYVGTSFIAERAAVATIAGTVSSATSIYRGSYFTAGASANDDWTIQNVVQNISNNTISNVAETAGNAVTLTITGGTFATGQIVTFANLTVATWLNGQNATLTGANATTLTFTDPTSHGLLTSTAETGTVIVANPTTQLQLIHSSGSPGLSSVLVPAGTTTVPGLVVGSAGFGLSSSATQLLFFMNGSKGATLIASGGFQFDLNSSATPTWYSINNDCIWRRLGSRIWESGGNDGPTPAASTIQIGESSRPGTDVDIGGATGTIRSGIGTGIGTASTLNLATTALGVTGSAVQTLVNRLVITAGSITSTEPIVLPDTAGSGVPSLKGATAASGVYLNGVVVGLVSANAGWITIGNTAAAGVQCPLSGAYSFSSSNTIGAAASDAFMSRAAAQSIQFARPAAQASPLPYTITIGEASRGGTDTNVAGAIGTIQSGLGTGNALPSKLIIQGPALAASGTTAQTQIARWVSLHVVNLTNNTAKAVARSGMNANNFSGVIFRYTIECTDNTEFQMETGLVSFVSFAKSAVINNSTPVKSGTNNFVSAGTLAVTFTSVTNGSSVDLTVTSNSSLTPVTHRILFEMVNTSSAMNVTLL